MSSAAALTIIAISVGILAILAILGVIFMLRLVLHLLAFEETVVHELGELKQLANQLRETTERVGHTVRDVQVAARRVGGAVGTVASLFSLVMGRTNPSSRRARLRPWWLTGASLGMTIWRRRRQAKKNAKPRRGKKTSISGGSDSSLTL